VLPDLPKNPRDEGAGELCGSPTVGSYPKIWFRGQIVNNL